MSDLSKGYSFTGTSPNNTVTAEKLNALVDQATIQTGFYTDRPEAASGSEADYLLLFNTAAANFQKIRKGNLITAGNAKSGFSNLVIANNAAAPTAKLDVTASELVLRSDAGNVRHANAFSRTLDASSYSGAATPDGRDFPTLQADTWYYIWAISDGSNDRLLLSASASSPILPAGFPYKVLLGAVRSDHFAHFVTFFQRNCEVSLGMAGRAGAPSPYLNPSTGATPAEFTSASCDVLQTLQSVDLSNCVPPGITSAVRGLIGQSVDPGGVNYVYALASAGTGAMGGASSPSDLVGLQIVGGFLVATAVQMYGFYNAAPFEIPIQTSQSLVWTATVGAGRHSMRISGFTLSL